MELLVVIAITALLAGLLLPALSRVRAKAEQGLCLGNLRQLSIAWTLYAGDHRDEVIGNGGWSPTPGGTELPTWATPVFNDEEWLSITVPTKPPNWDPGILRRRSAILPYLNGSIAVLHCPSDRSTGTDRNGKVVPRPRSVALNSWVGGPGIVNQVPNPEPRSWKWMVFRRLGDFQNPGPSWTFTFLDERWDSINNGYFSQSMEGYAQRPALWYILDFPAGYHGRAGSLVFADSHAEAHVWTDRRTAPPARKNTELDSIASPGNPDVLWLMDHSTRPVE